VINPGKLLGDLKRTVALRGGFLVWMTLCLYLSPVRTVPLLAAVVVSPLWSYGAYRGATAGFESKIEVLYTFVLPYAILTAVLGLYRYTGRPVLTGAVVFSVFAVYRAYVYWDTIKNAKRIARMIRESDDGRREHYVGSVPVQDNEEESNNE